MMNKVLCPHAMRSPSQRGFTLIELIIVILIVVIMAGLFLSRVPSYQERAEKAAMEQVVGAIQSALVLRYGTLITRGADRQKELGNLSTDNPMNWLQQRPNNYAGEYFAPSLQTITPGHWMFDLKSHDLIYVPDHSDGLKPDKEGNKWIRFHIKLAYEPILGQSGAGKELTTTVFEPTMPYDWLD